MEKEYQEIVKLVALSAKVTEEAKKAEAHARASKAFARKVTKEADSAYESATNLLSISRSLVSKFLDDSGIPVNDIEKRLIIEKTWKDMGVNAETLKAVLKIPVDESEKSGSKINMDLTKFDSKVIDRLCLSGVEQRLVQDMLKTGLVTTEKYPTMNLIRPASADRIRGGSQDPVKGTDIFLSNIGLGSNQNPALAVGTKRRSRRRNKASAMGIPSPLLSREDLTIVKRSTSPNPSQTSGMSPFVGAQCKYTLRRNCSATSQRTTPSAAEDDGSSVTSYSASPNEQDRSGSPK